MKLRVQTKLPTSYAKPDSDDKAYTEYGRRKQTLAVCWNIWTTQHSWNKFFFRHR